MPDLVLLRVAQMRRIEPFLPRSRGLPRVDDRRVVGGIVTVIRHGLQWKDAPTGHGPVSPAPPDRERLWQTEGLAPRRHALRPMRTHLLLRHLHRSHTHLVAVKKSPEPRADISRLDIWFQTFLDFKHMVLCLNTFVFSTRITGSNCSDNDLKLWF